MKEITKISDTQLDTVSDSDFEYGFELGELCEIKSHGHTIIGRLSVIGDDSLTLSFTGEEFDCRDADAESEFVIDYADIDEMDSIM